MKIGLLRHLFGIIKRLSCSVHLRFNQPFNGSKFHIKLKVLILKMPFKNIFVLCILPINHNNIIWDETIFNPEETKRLLADLKIKPGLVEIWRIALFCLKAVVTKTQRPFPFLMGIDVFRPQRHLKPSHFLHSHLKDHRLLFLAPAWAALRSHLC